MFRAWWKLCLCQILRCLNWTVLRCFKRFVWLSLHENSCVFQSYPMWNLFVSDLQCLGWQVSVKFTSLCINLNMANNIETGFLTVLEKNSLKQPVVLAWKMNVCWRQVVVISPYIRWNTHSAVKRGQPYAQEIDDLNQTWTFHHLLQSLHYCCFGKCTR